MRSLLSWFASLSFFLFPYGSAMAGVPLRSNGTLIRVPAGEDDVPLLRLKLSRIVHLAEGETGVDRRETGASVHAAVMEAARAWTASGKAKIEIEFEFTDLQRAVPEENVVTFTDPEPFDTGVCDKAAFIACTILSFSQETGEVLGVTIAFNPYMRHSSIGLAGTHDIGLIARHEIGHALGLDHSPLLDSIMNATVELAGADAQLPFAVRDLAPDDVNTLWHMYPRDDEEAPKSGALRGTLLLGGAAVQGAHVFAMDVAGHPVAGTLTNSDGAYTLPLPAGVYTIAAEPLDGPSRAAQVRSRTGELVLFPTMFWTAEGGHARDRGEIEVAGGETREGVDIRIAEGAVVNAETIGVIEDGLYLGTPRLTVARGAEYMLAVTRPVPQGEETPEPELRVLAEGVEFEGAARIPSGAKQIVRRKLIVAAEAPVGVYTVQYLDGNSGSLLPGGLRIAPKPAVSEVLDLATGEAGSYRAGQRLLVKGSDLAATERDAPEPPIENARRPAQLGGISVRIGDRWAPVWYVSPREVVIEVPAGLAGETAEVAVVAGPGIESAPVKVTLAQ